MSVTVSLAITTYKSASYLYRTLSSTLNQIVPFDQIIVVDDCSQDNGQQIIDAFNTTFNQNVIFCSLPSNFGGPARSRNTALSMSHCDLITYLDADDILLPARCLNIKTQFLSQPFDASVCRARIFKVHPHTLTISLKAAFPCRSGSSILHLSDLLDLTLLTPGSSLCFRTSILRLYKFSEDLDIIAGEDREILIRLAIDARLLIYSNDIDFLYNSGFIGTGLLKDKHHITSPTRTLRIISYLRSKFRNLLPANHYTSFDFSHLLALLRLRRYKTAFKFLLSLAPASHLRLAGYFLSRLLSRFFNV